MDSLLRPILLYRFIRDVENGTLFAHIHIANDPKTGGDTKEYRSIKGKCYYGREMGRSVSGHVYIG